MYKKDFLSEFRDKVKDEQTNAELIKSKGGWHSVLTNAGFIRRQDKTMYPGDVVIAENAIGISDGYKGLFSGGAFRGKDKITDVYYYTEK